MSTFVKIAAAAAIALSLSACGSQDDSSGSGSPSPTPLTTLSLAEVNASVVKQLQASKTVKVAVNGTNKGEKVASSLVLSMANGVPEYDMTVDTPAEGSEPASKVRMIILKDALYVSMAGEEAEPGKPWSKVDLTAKNPLAKIFVVLSSSMKSLVNPEQSQLAAEAAGTLTAAKPEKVGAVDTMHYTVTVDMEAAVKKMDLRKYLANATDLLKQMPALDKKTQGTADKMANLSDADLEKLRANMLKSTKGVKATSEVWLDAQGRPVKQASNLPVAGTPQQVELTYSDWGTAAITVPPAGQVAEMPELPTGN